MAVYSNTPAWDISQMTIEDQVVLYDACKAICDAANGIIAQPRCTGKVQNFLDINATSFAYSAMQKIVENFQSCDSLSKDQFDLVAQIVFPYFAGLESASKAQAVIADMAYKISRRVAATNVSSAIAI